jgi:FkbM family methyltransferase
MLPPVNLIDAASGRYLLFATQDAISVELYLRGVWEQATVALAQKLLASPWSKGRGTVIDAGANLGAFTIPLARKLPAEMSVHCFEAQRIVFYQLCGNVVLNRLANVHPHHVGLSNVTQQLAIQLPDYQTDMNLGNWSLKQDVHTLRGDKPVSNTGAMETVQVVPLDSFKFADVALLKIDVEGLELEVLQGAQETLSKCDRPPILLELWSKEKTPGFAAQFDRIIGHLNGIGYDTQILNGTMCVAQARGRPSLGITSAENGTLSVFWKNSP